MAHRHDVRRASKAGVVRTRKPPPSRTQSEGAEPVLPGPRHPVVRAEHHQRGRPRIRLGVRGRDHRRGGEVVRHGKSASRVDEVRVTTPAGLEELAVVAGRRKAFREARAPEREHADDFPRVGHRPLDADAPALAGRPLAPGAELAADVDQIGGHAAVLQVHRHLVQTVPLGDAGQVQPNVLVAASEVAGGREGSRSHRHRPTGGAPRWRSASAVARSLAPDRTPTGPRAVRRWGRTRRRSGATPRAPARPPSRSRTRHRTTRWTRFH